AARRNDRDARVRASARDLAPALGALRATGVARSRRARLARLGRRRPFPGAEHPRVLAAMAGAAPPRRLARGRRLRSPRRATEPGRRDRRVGEASVTAARPRRAFYALGTGGWRDYVTLLHPPYTLWHLSYVAVGAALAPKMDWGLWGWTTLAFALAMGVGA